MLLGVSLAQMNLFPALVLFVLSVLAFAGIGILSATFALVFKKGDPLLWVVGGLSWLLGGVFYPLEVLPPLLRQAAALLPITHALSGMRMAILEGASLAAVTPQIAALSLFAAIGLPVSLLLFLAGMRWTRASGSLGHF
jgi:ABC-2 type transport system permease protein